MKGKGPGPVPLLAISIALVVLVAGCTSEDKDGYVVTFTALSDDPMIDQGTTAQGMTTQFTFKVDQTNLTKVELKLAWFDDSGDGCDDLFELTVVSADPSAVYQPQQTVQGTTNIHLTVVVNTLPTTKKGDDQDKLQEYLDRMVSEKGIGDWKVSITCVNAQPDCADPKASDDGNNWVLTVTVFHFEGDISPTTG